MGLVVSVYKDSDRCDCTNNGVTNRFSRLCVVNVEGPFVPDEKTPAVVLVKGYLDGTVMILPVELKGARPMMGGNFASTCDSRFSHAIEKITGSRFYGAVPVHDRVE